MALIPLLIACLLAPEPFRRGLALCVALIFAATVAVTRQLSMRLLLADVEKSHQLRQITAAKSEFEALAGTDGLTGVSEPARV